MNYYDHELNGVWLVLFSAVCGGWRPWIYVLSIYNILYLPLHILHICSSAQSAAGGRALHTPGQLNARKSSLKQEQKLSVYQIPIASYLRSRSSVITTIFE